MAGDSYRRDSAEQGDAPLEPEEQMTEQLLRPDELFTYEEEAPTPLDARAATSEAQTADDTATGVDVPPLVAGEHSLAEADKTLVTAPPTGMEAEVGPGTTSPSTAEAREPATEEVGGLPDLRAGFVGRSELLGRLGELFRATCDEQKLGFVTLIGPPGIGKTRLAREFARSVRRSRPDVRVLWGAASDPVSAPYAALAQALSDRCGVRPGDDADAAREKLTGAVAEVMEEGQRESVTHLLAHLMQIPFPDSAVIDSLARVPGHLEVRCYVAMRRFLQRDLRGGPLLLCIDGTERASAEAVNLIHFLAEGLQHAPLMILTTAGPTLFRRHPRWGQGDFGCERIEVGALDPNEAEQLLSDLARAEEVPTELRQIAREDLRDSPRSIYELVRYLLEAKVLQPAADGPWTLSAERLRTIELPRTHEDILRARLQALPRIEQDMIRKAAAVGEAFWRDAVVALLRTTELASEDRDGPTLEAIAANGERSRNEVATGLKRLVSRGLIREVPSTIAGEREYRFAYPPIWDLTYELLDDALRHGYHNLAAQWLEARPAGRAGQNQEQVGYHLERAGDGHGAAVRYRRAAESARLRYFNDKAIRLYQRALACLGKSELGTRLQLWHDLGSVYQHKGEFDEALDAFERMVRLAWLMASRPKTAVAFNKLGRVWRAKGNLELALEYLERGLTMFRQADDDRGVATSLDDIARVYWLLGRHEEALDHAAEGLEGRRRLGDRRSVAVSLSNIGNIQKDRGLLEQAESCHREALDLRRQVGDLHGYVISTNNLGAIEYDRGLHDEARQTWERGLAEAERIGAAPLVVVLLNNLGELALERDRLADARHRLERALRLATEMEEQRTCADVLRNLALVELASGDRDRAQKHAQRSLELAERASIPEMVARAHLALADVGASTLFDTSSAQQVTGSAADHFRSAIQLFGELGKTVEQARALRRLGEYQIERGELQSGRECLQRTLDLLEQHDAAEAASVERMLADLG